MSPYNHILVATKFSPACEVATKRAGELARLFGARLTLLHVIEHFPELTEACDPKAILEQRARERLERAAQEHDLPSAVRLVQLSNFSARRTLVEQVREQGVDLLVLGSPIHQGLLGHIGSTASTVAVQAPCEVLLVRPPS